MQQGTVAFLNVFVGIAVGIQLLIKFTDNVSVFPSDFYIHGKSKFFLMH